MHFRFSNALVVATPNLAPAANRDQFFSYFYYRTSHPATMVAVAVMSHNTEAPKCFLLHHTVQLLLLVGSMVLAVGDEGAAVGVGVVGAGVVGAGVSNSPAICGHTDAA